MELKRAGRSAWSLSVDEETQDGTGNPLTGPLIRGGDVLLCPLDMSSSSSREQEVENTQDRMLLYILYICKYILYICKYIL